MGALFQRLGVPGEDAGLAAAAIVSADLLGFETHGIRKFGNHVSRLAEEKLPAKAPFRVLRETPVSALVDGGGGLGFAVASRAMGIAISKAKGAGAGIVAVRNSSTFGPCGVYARMALAEGMIGAAATNAAGKSVVPAGGTAALFSTNPFGFAIPAGAAGGLLLDGSSSVTAWTRVMDKQWFKQPIPHGWGVDEKGRITTDYEKIKAVLPLGSTLELGAARGYGLVLAVEALAGVLSGGMFAGGEYPPTEKGRGTLSASHFLLALRVDIFRPLEEFRADMDRLLAYALSSPAAAGAEPVRTPGQRALAEEKRRLAEGIPLDEKVIGSLKKIGEKHGVPWES